MAWYWRAVEQRLRDPGHEAVALELPGDDPDAGLTADIELTVKAAKDRDDLVVAGQPMGAFTAVPVCDRVSARRLILLNAMIPLPGERAGEWWVHTGAVDTRRAAARAAGYPEMFDVHTYFPTTCHPRR